MLARPVRLIVGGRVELSYSRVKGASATFGESVSNSAGVTNKAGVFALGEDLSPSAMERACLTLEATVRPSVVSVTMRPTCAL